MRKIWEENEMRSLNKLKKQLNSDSSKSKISRQGQGLNFSIFNIKTAI